MADPKYPGLNENDTFWDDYHKSKGMMTNREFFTSNAPGGFYEGMQWNEGSQQWEPNEATRERERLLEESRKCPECGHSMSSCQCE